MLSVNSLVIAPLRQHRHISIVQIVTSKICQTRFQQFSVSLYKMTFLVDLFCFVPSMFHPFLTRTPKNCPFSLKIAKCSKFRSCSTSKAMAHIFIIYSIQFFYTGIQLYISVGTVGTVGTEMCKALYIKGLECSIFCSIYVPSCVFLVEIVTF